jgi:hypothetical protein
VAFQSPECAAAYPSGPKPSMKPGYFIKNSGRASG